MVVKKPGLAPGLFLHSIFYLQNKDFRVGLPGLEPGTSSLSEKRSNRLSYRPEMGSPPGKFTTLEGP
jgi:hypothetical protein